MTRWWRSTIRVRLTMLYAGAFILAGAALIALTYVYLGQTLDHQLTARVDITERLTADFRSGAEGLDSPRMAQLHEAFIAQFQ